VRFPPTYPSGLEQKFLLGFPTRFRTTGAFLLKIVTASWRRTKVLFTTLSIGSFDHLPGANRVYTACKKPKNIFDSVNSDNDGLPFSFYSPRSVNEFPPGMLSLWLLWEYSKLSRGPVKPTRKCIESDSMQLMAHIIKKTVYGLRSLRSLRFREGLGSKQRDFRCFALAPFFKRAKHRKFRSFVFLSSPTLRTRLLRRLRCLTLQHNTETIAKSCSCPDCTCWIVSN